MFQISIALFCFHSIHDFIIRLRTVHSLENIVDSQYFQLHQFNYVLQILNDFLIRHDSEYEQVELGLLQNRISVTTKTYIFEIRTTHFQR